MGRSRQFVRAILTILAISFLSGARNSANQVRGEASPSSLKPLIRPTSPMTHAAY